MGAGERRWVNRMNKEERLYNFADKVINLCERKDLERFDGFFPIDVDIYEDPDDYGFWMDTTTDCLSCPVDVSLYLNGDPNGVGAQKSNKLVRLKALSHKEFRKKTGAFVVRPYIFEVAYSDKKYVADAFMQEVNKKLSYVEIGGFKTDPVAKHWILERAQTLLGIQFNLENQCYVYLKPDYASIGFKYPLDDLRQVKELFSLRDIPDGYKRRAALRHWVASHSRRKPAKPDELVEVKKYLRGKQDFKWLGLSGTIYVN